MTNNPKEMFRGFRIVDCAVRSVDHFYFVATRVGTHAEADPSEHAIRIGVFFPNAPAEQQWAFRTLLNLEFMQCAVAQAPAPHLVGISLDGQVFALGSGSCDFENGIPEHKDGPLRGSVRHVMSVDGMVYAVQGNRGLCRRLGPDRWQSLCSGLPVASTWQRRGDDGFRYAAATSASNIYAGGGRGDLWHHDGKSWTNLHFPSNVLIESMCCAGPNDVYVGCQNGIVYRGRRDTWKKISDGDLTLPFGSMVAYGGQVWCTSDYGLWVIEGDSVRKADVPVEVFVKAGVLATKDDVLLVAGMNGAAYHHRGQWHECLHFM